MKSSAKNQRGITLIILMIALVLAVATLLVNLEGSSTTRLLARESSLAALKTARDALLIYALRYDETHPGQPPGYLPCPDTDGDGIAELSCSPTGQSVIGFLPWRTLGLTLPRDQSGACLWYAVSGQYKYNPKQALSSDSDGQFVILDGTGAFLAGSDPSNRAAALIFAPHNAIDTQERSFTSGQETNCGSLVGSDPINQPENYLDRFADLNNATGTDQTAGTGQPGSLPLPTTLASVFTIGSVDEPSFNDRLIWISNKELEAVQEKMAGWVLNRVARCLEQYQADNGGKFSWLAPLSGALPPTYIGIMGERFGRIPTLPDTAGDATMSSSWPIDPDDPSATFSCFTMTGSQTDYSWWWWQDTWKEQVFIGIDSDYVPTGTGSATPSMTLDGAGASAVALVSGRRTQAQQRMTDLQKGTITNYLGTENAPDTASGNIPPGDEHFQATDTADNDQGK